LSEIRAEVRLFTRNVSSLGRLENLAVHRDNRPKAQFDERTAPADVTFRFIPREILSQRVLVLPATMRRTIEQGAGPLMWSVRMIGVALAFLAPWIIALAAFIGVVHGVGRSRRHRQQ